MFSAIAHESPYQKLDSGYNINNIQNDLDNIDTDKLKLVNMVDSIFTDETKDSIAKNTIDFITTKNYDIDVLLKNIKQLDEILRELSSFQDKLELETLLSLSDEDKKEMVKLFLERVTFIGNGVDIVKKKRKLIRWIDKSQDINVDM
jgi:hypothetical protein